MRSPSRTAGRSTASTIIELSQIERTLTTKSQNTLFQPAEVELNNLSEAAARAHRRSSSPRAWCSTRFRRCGCWRRARCATGARSSRSSSTSRRCDCTVLLLDDRSAIGPDVQVQSIVHGMLIARRRAAQVRHQPALPQRDRSCAARRFREGNHDYVIKRGGLTLFPRLVAADHPRTSRRTRSSSGNQELDTLLGGGLDAGTSNLSWDRPAAASRRWRACSRTRRRRAARR